MFKIKQKTSWLRTGVLCATTMVIIVVGVALYNTYATNQAASPNTVATKQADLPKTVVAEKPVEQKQTYTVPADQPRNLIIKKLGIHANILSLGVTATGAMDAPATAWDVGWYNQSALPGTTGALLMDGHVNNVLNTPGVFYKLDTLLAGDTLQVERGDGQLFTYAVVSVEQKPIEQVNMTKMMRSITPGKQGLNLITCGGDYDTSRKTYEDRILVYAEQIS